MDLIIETDIGHDPDDFFTLCYLHSAGVNIKAILVAPGHKYQMAIVRAFCKEVGLDIPIGFAKKTDVDKNPSKSFHMAIVNSLGYPYEDDGDGWGHEIVADVLKEYPECEVFLCGPLKSFGRYIMENPDTPISRVTMQGGFLPYDAHNYEVERLSKFEGKTAVPTFNLNGSVNEGKFLAASANVADLRFVGKNVCHTILYNRERHEWIKEVEPKDRAQELFVMGMDRYLQKHSEKKFHDPTAAACHLHPEIGTWVQGTLYREKGHWGAFAMEGTNTNLLADIDRNALWDCIRSGT